ncbi:hypothetical protein SASPL_156071 [Salvia splendens]|uniref:Terpene synthase metal-binding domain-containing protein n=1 Tax=Salvia splendens TaxID=180675 RepID=A0A8X8YWF8_SALSN|nr:hypothetical protein SASPL_156071 [Salvia splendens]
MLSLPAPTVTSPPLLLWNGTARKEHFEWLSKKPKMLVAALTICRLVGDASSYETEKERGQVATGMDSYMRENGVTRKRPWPNFGKCLWMRGRIATRSDSYHFEDEIEEKLQQYFHLDSNYHDDEAYDLYTHLRSGASEDGEGEATFFGEGWNAQLPALLNSCKVLIVEPVLHVCCSMIVIPPTRSS